MNFNEYQKLAKKTEWLSDKEELKIFGNDLVNATLGIAGEAGEFADKIKKLYRDKGGKLDAQYKQDLIYELGDILWYMANMAGKLGVKFDVIARMNIKKLASRKKRGKLAGSGDHR